MNISIKAGVLAGVVVTVLGGFVLAVSLWLAGDKSPVESANEAAFQTAWDSMSEADRESACFAVLMFGTEGVADLMRAELEDTPFDADYISRRFAEECSK